MAQCPRLFFVDYYDVVFYLEADVAAGLHEMQEDVEGLIPFQVAGEMELFDLFIGVYDIDVVPPLQGGHDFFDRSVFKNVFPIPPFGV